MPRALLLRFVVIALAVMVLPSIARAQFNTTFDGNGGVVITGYTGTVPATLNIPSTINGMPVTAIGDHAFQFNRFLTYITIPDSVTSIGVSAFDTSTLASITIPASVTSIGSSAFSGSDINSVTLSSGLTSIGDNAFEHCIGLTSVTIPDSVGSLGMDVFIDCTNLTSISVSSQNAVFTATNGVLFDKNQVTLIECPAGKSGNYSIPNGVTNIQEDAFIRCTKLTGVTLPNSVITIGDSAFSGCTGLAGVTIPNSVTTIGNSAFSGCAGMTSVSIANSVLTIGDSAFSGTGLTSVTIPASVTALGSDVFDGCISLTSINVSPQNTTYSSIGGVLFSQDKTELIEYPPGKAAAAYTVPSGVTLIDSFSFFQCNNLLSVSLSEGVTTLAGGAFWQCISLTSVTIPSTLTSIAPAPFYECTSFNTVTVAPGNTAYRSVDGVILSSDGTTLILCPQGLTGTAGVFTVPATVVNIGSSAFSFCTNLTSIILPDNLVSIGEDSFSVCTGLTSVTIPRLVNNIAGGAFYDCFQLKVAIFDGNAPQVALEAFFGTDPNFTIEYYTGATGFTSPTWNDSGGDSYPAADLGPYPFPTFGSTLSATSVSTTSVRVDGAVDDSGFDTQVFVDFGTDPTLTTFNSVSASPSVVRGDTLTPVSALLANLMQGTTYYYRLRGVSSGGTAESATSSFQTQLLSALTRSLPPVPLAHQGSITVNLTPSGINSGWRLVGEQLWRASGSLALGLTTGDYQVEYKPVGGYIQPGQEFLSVASGSLTTVTREYYPTSVSGTGQLSILLEPQGLAGAQWRIAGTTTWSNSGDVLSGLAAGFYLIECQPVTGQTTPATASVQVTAGSETVAQLNYFVSTPATGATPQALSFATVSNSATPTLPYAFVGQLRTDKGSATGFVVTPHVVVTAGHVVFDDSDFTYVKSLQWLFQRSAGTYEPVPVAPNGSLVFSGYADQRKAENTPGISSPNSQNRDVAALYFSTEPGGGGYSGYLASDSTANEYLTSTANKMLVGYPIDGIDSSLQGEMFATAPVTDAFTQVPGNDSGTNPTSNPPTNPSLTYGLPYQVYYTSALSSVGGNSGGPLCVQYSDGNYYPAAIYLGGSVQTLGSPAQTVVRAFDSNVISLIQQAETNGSTGSNNASGGATLTSTSLLADNLSLANLTVTFTAGAPAGAGWALSPTDTFLAGGATRSFLSPGTYTIYFAPVTGYTAPTATTIALAGGTGPTYNATYSAVGTTLTFDQWSTLKFGSVQSETAMPQKDGVANLLKYAFDIDPTKPVSEPDRAALPALGIDTTTMGGPYLTLTYREYQFLDPSVAIALQKSTDLLNWMTITPSAVHQTTATNGDLIIEDEVPITGPKLFLRLDVSGP